MNFSIFVSSLALVLALIGAPASAGQYQVVTEEWAPYNYLENGRVSGMTTEIVRAIMKITGDDFEIALLPSLRSRLMLNTQPKTIMYSLFRTPERESLYKWIGPIVEESIFPYQLANAQPLVNSLQQLLRAPKITTRQAGIIPEMLRAQGFRNLDTSAGGNVQLYRMLLAGRTDIIVGDTRAGVAYYSRQLNVAPGTLRQVPVELYRASLYIAFSRDCDDKVLAAWSSALAQLRTSGELARIERRHLQTDGL
jgi:polar amino acid transport system substrate-binding protein